MKKLIFPAIIALALAAAAIAYIRFLAPATQFESSHKFLYIHTLNPSREAVLDALARDSMVKNTGHFDWLAKRLDYWPQTKPGKYKIEQNMSVLEMVKLLRSGAQTPSRLVINKLRLPEDLARLMARAIESDSTQIISFLQHPDSLAAFGITPDTWATLVIPDTYEVYWTSPIGKVMQKLKENHDRWWNKNERLARAEQLGLSPEKAYIIASIVEEETNVAADKPLVASVYLNRLRIGMPLQADPTVRFAMKNFSLNRIYYSHLRTPSPYNTYLNRGLPPGPICTPSQATLDSVLRAPKTDYIFFVANADLRGGSTFTTNLADHGRAAKLYQDSLTAWLKRKAAKEQAVKDSMEKAANATKG